MKSALDVLDHLRTVVSTIDRDAPAGMRWLRSEILALVGSPRVRRWVRNQLIRELAGHFRSNGALAAALNRYAGRCWAREQHLTSPPEGASAERVLLWKIFNVGLPVPTTEEGIRLILPEVPQVKPGCALRSTRSSLVLEKGDVT
jgi:hypothetical protein